MSGTRVYVLGPDLELLPPGAIGEVFIAGDGVAMGYVGAPALTAERFVAEPFGSRGERMYRTGDLGRWTAEGDLDFVGRADTQVKIRGHRVEPGELQVVLARHPGVAAAAVVAATDLTGTRLLAYVVPAVETPGLVDVLFATLRGVLPEHMMPAAITRLDRLPLTHNGKLDRAALPAPVRPESRSGRSPRSPQEAALCDVYAEVFGLDTVTVDDDFFALGGHSLLAVKLVNRIREVLAHDVPLAVVFDRATPAAIAAHLAARTGDPAEPARPRLRPVTSGEADPV